MYTRFCLLHFTYVWYTSRILWHFTNVWYIRNFLLQFTYVCYTRHVLLHIAYVAKHPSLLHDKYVIVSADKAPNNIVCVCKSHYIDCLIKELGINMSLGNPIYTPTTLTKEEILDNHRSVLCFMFGISTKDEELDLPSLYWIPKLHNCWVCQMLNETSFQIINMYSIGGQNRASGLL